jgi:hypothetical protein
LRRARWFFAIVELFRRFAISTRAGFKAMLSKAIGSAMAEAKANPPTRKRRWQRASNLAAGRGSI